MTNKDLSRKLREWHNALGCGESLFDDAAHRLDSNEETLRKYEKIFEENGKTIADLNSDVELSHKRINELLSQLEALQPAPPKRIPPKDAKVLVWEKDDRKKSKRHSTGATDHDGYLLCYPNGKTSFTCTDNTEYVPWKHWDEVA